MSLLLLLVLATQVPQPSSLELRVRTIIGSQITATDGECVCTYEHIAWPCSLSEHYFERKPGEPVSCVLTIVLPKPKDTP